MATYNCKGCKKQISERGRMPITGQCKPCRSGQSVVDGRHLNMEQKAKPDFSVYEYNKKRIKHYRELLDEVERQNELWEGELMFVDLWNKEVQRAV